MKIQKVDDILFLRLKEEKGYKGRLPPLFALLDDSNDICKIIMYSVKPDNTIWLSIHAYKDIYVGAYTYDNSTMLNAIKYIEDTVDFYPEVDQICLNVVNEKASNELIESFGFTLASTNPDLMKFRRIFKKRRLK